MVVQYMMLQRLLKLIPNIQRHALFTDNFFIFYFYEFIKLAIVLESQGYYRRGAAYLAMGKFKEALKDFQQRKLLKIARFYIKIVGGDVLA